ncbi:YIP1 family protein [Halorussus salilacus]|uniref:Yip1 family protein n=1 Tax=Halorussus salilacus TaxID=2953750 RepID=UPI00209CF884|nr:Yip1 family protein [Halorussus salilacus]USZ69178.1 YIP1 family protein [Halorussus salilacus]
MVLDALLRPDEFFGERAPGLSLASAALVVLAVAVVTTAALGAFGWVLSERLTATTEVPNENRPPDWVCDDEPETEAEERMHEDCDQPEHRTVAVGDLLWDAFVDHLPTVFVGVLVGWPLVAVGLHVASAVFGGEGSFADTLAVAAWGMLPTAFQVLAGLALLLVSLNGIDLSASDPELLASRIESLSRRAQGESALLSLAVACWQGYVWTFGLKHARKLPTGAAAFAGGGVAFLGLLFALA